MNAKYCSFAFASIYKYCLMYLFREVLLFRSKMEWFLFKQFSSNIRCHGPMLAFSKYIVFIAVISKNIFVLRGRGVLG